MTKYDYTLRDDGKVCLYLAKEGIGKFPPWCALYGCDQFDCGACKGFVERRK